MATLTDEVTDVLQRLIRNACVNDGTVESGGEVRSVDLLGDYLGSTGLEMQTYEPVPGRGSLVCRIEGSDPAAPSLALMGHLDVVPVNADRWERDPFEAELVDGVVWGRGAVDMLNTTSSMAVAFKHLAESGFTPRGTLSYIACADEEALGTHGAQWLVENELDAVRADYVITEFGGMRYPLETKGGVKLPVMVGEKGTYWCKLRVRGTPGHGSMPFRTDNAVVKAAEVVQRIARYRPPAQFHDVWRRFVEAMGFAPELRGALLDPDGFYAMCENLPIGLGRSLHACTHTTFAPTIISGGVKTNIIPDTTDIQIDIRTLPGQTAADVRAMLAEAIGDMWEHCEIVDENPNDASASPMDTPLWDVLARVTEKLVPGATTVPGLIVGATDSRFFRRAGITAYGYGILSERIPFNEFMQMFHGDNERVDQDSLRLSTELWIATAREFLDG